MPNLANMGSLALLASFAAPALAQNCPTLLDFNPFGSPVGSFPAIQLETVGGFPQVVANQSLPIIGGKALFSAADPTAGRELFATGGTLASAELLGDISPGFVSSNPQSFTEFGGLIYFFADDPVHGFEVWKTDGTSAGTQLAFEVVPGAQDAFPNSLSVVNGRLVFSAAVTGGVRELYSSDGTAAGTAVIVPASVVTPDSPVPTAGPSRLYVRPDGAWAYFEGLDGSSNYGLWRTDGTAAGTQLVSNVVQPTSNPHTFGWEGVAWLGNDMVFVATDGGTGRELWITDGTAAGTQRLSDMNPGAGDADINLHVAVERGGVIYFRADDGSHGAELWRTDGTPAGTQLLTDLEVGAAGSAPFDLTLFGSDIFFTASSSTTGLGRELWRLDASGLTIPVGDFNPGAGDAFVDGNNAFAVAGGRLYFAANDGVHGIELWSSDGTTAAMVDDQVVGSAGAFPEHMTELGGGVVFFAGSTLSGTEVWFSDGVTITPAANVGAEAASGSSDPLLDYEVLGDVLYFAPYNQLEGHELHRWDPVNGASLVADLWPGQASGMNGRLAKAWLGGKGVVFFAGNDGVSGTEPWMHDGVTTTMLGDLSPIGDSDPEGFVGDGERVYFSAKAASERSLWVTDGVVTTQLTPAGVAVASTLVQLGAFVGDQFVFAASTAATGQELWVTDGTPAGTHMLLEIAAGTLGANPGGFVRFEDVVVFSARTASTGTEPWMTDGTPAGTQMIVDFNPGASSSLPLAFTPYNGELYFRGTVSGVGGELCKTDLTAAGTVVVNDTWVGSGSGSASWLTPTNSGLYFVSQNIFFNTELYRTDGTPGGTVLVAEAQPGAAGSSPAWLVPAGDGVYFTATVPGVGRELLYADAGGGQVVCDIEPGATSAEVARLAVVGGHVVFEGTTALSGTELMVLDPERAVLQDLGLSGNGSQLRATPAVLGGSVTLSSVGHEPGVHVIVMAGPVPAPTSVLTTPESAVWLNVLGFNIVNVFTGTSQTLSQAVPSDPALAGVRVNLQTATLPGAAFPATTGNGLSFTLGS